ncbi:MAG: Gldg family protein, partial [Lentisphaeria bacterium]|nr:Gldg family protein [Lentisphaeria bacterium]
LFSVGGIIVMAVLLVAVNAIFQPFNLRIDCTKEGLYTLSEGTRAILKEVKEEEAPIEIRFYFSKDIPSLPVYLKAYANRVEDLLKEYEQKSGGLVGVEKKNPKPYSDDEDSAGIDNIAGQPMGAFGAGDKVYLGLAISCFDETETIPFLSPQRENMLEYDITRAIHRVMNPKKNRIGVLSSLPIMGSITPPNPMMGMQQPNQKPAWVVINELKRDYEVVEIQKNTESIDPDLDVLLLVHPKGLEDKTLFAIDQYLLGGGRILAFLDTLSVVEQQNQQGNPQMRFMPPGQSELGKLMEAWGVELSKKILADREFGFKRPRRDGGADSMPTALALRKDAVDQDDPAVGQLESLLLFNAGVLTGSADGLVRTVLVHSSEDSQLVDTFMAQGGGDRILNDFKPGEKELALAVRLTGKFSTAFPEGKPSDDKDEDDGKEKEDGDKDDASNYLTEGDKGAVILVGDSDMIFDNFCVQVQNFFGQKIVQAVNDNLSFALNLVEQLSGDTRLISIRSRGTISRPLEEVHKRRAAAEKRNMSRVKAFEDERAELEKKLNEMLRDKAKTGSGRVVISKEQLEDIEKLREKKVTTNRKLKEEQKKMTREIESLENRLIWANILIVPLLVALSGLTLAFIKRRRMVRT